MFVMTVGGSARTRVAKNDLSMVTTWETLTTDGFGRPDSFLLTRTLPGTSASDRFDVITATMAVEMRLSLNGLD